MPDTIADYDRAQWAAEVAAFINAALKTYELPNVTPGYYALFEAPDHQFANWQCCVLGAALYQTFEDKRPEAFIVSLQKQSDYYFDVMQAYPFLAQTIDVEVYNKYIPSKRWNAANPEGHLGRIHLHEFVLGLFDIERLSVEEIQQILLNIYNDMGGES